jgi:UDP-2,3-diacylglucosamine pyrophosphatase LpxH
VRIRRALLLSDLHLGWVPLRASHRALLDHLPAAVDDAELVVLNGDVVDGYRPAPAAPEREAIARLAELVASWRREGREVVYVEGNHDPMHEAAGPLRPDRWFHDFEGADGARVRVLHGHRFDPAPYRPGPYSAWGRHLLALENRAYARVAALRGAYRHSLGWVVGAVGKLEDVLWRGGFARRAEAFAGEAAEILVHGHFHFGPGERPIGRLRAIRSGAWVSAGHRGTVDRILRYRDGHFERLGLSGGRWHVPADGR